MDVFDCIRVREDVVEVMLFGFVFLEVLGFFGRVLGCG